jgi:hypothetical protein
MHIYLTDALVPELKQLSSQLRRVVRLRATNLMKSRGRILLWLPVFSCAIGAVAGACLGGPVVSHLTIAGDTMSRQLLVPLAVPIIGGFLGGFLGNQVLFWRLRPFLRQALEECDCGQPGTGKSC